MATKIGNPLETAFLDVEKFDYIIAGGGQAGLVVATRLSEDPDVRVLVLEAGGNDLDDRKIRICGLAATLYDDPKYDWCFMTPPQEHVKGREFAVPRGKTLGGSGATNMCMVINTSKSSFDSWEKLGNPGWNWSTMRPYFKKFHTLNLPSEASQNELRLEHIDKDTNGIDGPIQFSFSDSDHYTPFTKAWIETFATLGHELTADPSSGISSGPFTLPGPIDKKTGLRSHAGNGHLNDSVAARPNLRVLTEVFVQKVLLKKAADGTFTAEGVRVKTKDGKEHDILAAEEVIIAAGTVKSPQLLELSGIGDAKLLKSHGIDVLIDNPNVGENFQDHGMVPFAYEVSNPQTSGDMLRDPTLAGPAIEAVLTSASGPLTIIPISSSFIPLVDYTQEEREALVKKYLDTFEYDSKIPSLKQQYAQLREIILSDHDATAQQTIAPFRIIAKDGPTCTEMFRGTRKGNYVTLVCTLNHPFSRGSIHIQSSDPFSPPIIDPRYLSHPLDEEIHARHLLWQEKLSVTPPLASLIKTGGLRCHSDTPVDTLEYAREVLKDCFLSNYHLTSTCSMLPKELGGVVDERLRVYGVKNLRIVDASVFPIIPRGNTQNSVYAVSESPTVYECKG